MQMKLTARTVKPLKAKARPYEVRDTEIKGFLLRVQPSGASTYYLDYRNAGGKRNRYRIGASPSVSPEQARDAAKLKYAEVTKGADVQAEKKELRKEAEREKKRTLRTFLDDVFSPWFQQNQSRSTDTVRRVRKCFPHLLSESMAEITPWALERWRMERKKRGRAATTINRDLAALKAVLSKAVEWEYLITSPIPRGKVKPLQVDERATVRYLAADEEKALRDALERREAQIRGERASANTWRLARGYPVLPDLWGATFADHLRPMTVLALNTGMRRGELFALRWEHVSPQTRMLTVQGKTAKNGKTRHLPLNDEAVDILKRWREQGSADGFVFPSKEGGRLDNIQTAWENVIARAGITAFRWHDLRHTFASKLVMAGVDLNTVRELLGHADIKMTLRYAHLGPEHKAEAVARLSLPSATR